MPKGWIKVTIESSKKVIYYNTKFIAGIYKNTKYTVLKFFDGTSTAVLETPEWVLKEIEKSNAEE